MARCFYHRSHNVGSSCSKGCSKVNSPGKCFAYRIYWRPKLRGWGEGRALNPDYITWLCYQQPPHFWLCPGPSPPAVCRTRFGHACWAQVMAGLFPKSTIRLSQPDRTMLGSLCPTSSPALSRVALQPHMPSC